MLVQSHRTFIHLCNTLRYFVLNPRDFWPCIDSNAITTFKAQKGSKHIVKIVHVTISGNFMKLREYFSCSKKTQITTLFNNFFSSVSVFSTRSRDYHDVCVRCCWCRSRRSDMEPGCAVPGLQAEEEVFINMSEDFDRKEDFAQMN